MHKQGRGNRPWGLLNVYHISPGLGYWCAGAGVLTMLLYRGASSSAGRRGSVAVASTASTSAPSAIKFRPCIDIHKVHHLYS